MRPPSDRGEVVFNTALTGYQEVFTDPSYSGQIVILTNPQIGNYGTSADDNESAGPYIEGLVVREFSPIASNWRCDAAADALPRPRRHPHRHRSRHPRPGPPPAHPRRHARRALRHRNRRRRSWSKKRASIPTMAGLDLASRVTTARALRVDRARRSRARPPTRSARQAEPRYHVVAYDYGIKHNILRRLVHVGLPRHRRAVAHHRRRRARAQSRRRLPLQRPRRSRAARHPGRATSASSSARSPSSASAWATSCSASPSAARPTS